MADKLAYVGRIEAITAIANADRIVGATVNCGDGGKWRGVVPKETFVVNDLCRVFLHDAVLPATPEFAFLEKRHYRIRLAKMRGEPSEVLIMPFTPESDAAAPSGASEGCDITDIENVTKYEKNLPASLAGTVKGNFPSQIPKTDEPNFQRESGMLALMKDVPVYITEKVDGSSCTVYHFLNGEKGVCSRNLDLKETEGNAFWSTARKYGLPDSLAPGMALQVELVGPGVQGNPMGLTEREFRVFNVWNENSQDYMDYFFARAYAMDLGVPFVTVLAENATCPTDPDALRKMAEGTYQNGKQREGIVIRPMKELKTYRGERVSVKALNGLYQG